VMKDTALKHCIKGIVFEGQRVSSSRNDQAFRNASGFRLFDQRLDWLDTTDVPSSIQEKSNTPASASANVQKRLEMKPVAQQVYEFQCCVVLINPA